MAAQEPHDPQVEIRGFFTDPKRVGYQILTNYESTYWRALIGNDAWSLYEVLRSFCHKGNDTCNPSIRLLTTILGFEDKRALIGRLKIVDGKEYCYSGLIEILQEYKLVVAEILGEEPETRYLFHVNLTPDRIMDEQIVRLPKILQEKHAELIKRCQQEQQALDAKRKPSRFQNGKKNSSGLPNEGGWEIPIPPVGNSHPPRGKFPPEQHPINNTHLTPTAACENNNNKSDAVDPKHDVVVALTTQGISEKVAQRLAGRYSCERITEKIDYLQFLLENRSEQVKNPRGWLRRAIEENYEAPDGFLSQAEHDRLAQEAVQRAQAEVEHASAVEALVRAQQASSEAQQAAFVQMLQAQYGTTTADYAFWAEVKRDLSYLARPDLFVLIEEAHILQRTDDTVLVGITKDHHLRQLSHPNTQTAIKRACTRVAGCSLELAFVLVAPPREPE